MDIAARVKEIFPRKSEIPAELWADLPLTQEGYLADGRVRKWTGPMHAVHSPVCVQNEGTPEPVRIGAYPLLTESESLQALEADACGRISACRQPAAGQKWRRADRAAR